MTIAPPHVPVAPPFAWLDPSPEGCVVFDAALHVRYCNPAFAARLGHTTDELLGKQLPAWLPGFAGSALHRLCEQVLAAGSPHEADERVGPRSFSLRAHPVPEGVLALVADVTPRRQREDDALELAGHARMLLEHLPSVHWTVDRELRFTLSRGAGLAALGLAQGEVVGRTLWDFYQTRDAEHPSIRAHLRALQGEGVSFADAHHGRHYHARVEPLRDREGAVAGVLGVAEDVTDQRQAAEERARFQQGLAQMQKLESLGVLAGGVAHDFNNLLAGILGAAELLLLDLPEGSPHRTAAEMIHTAGERARDVTRQMLVFSNLRPPGS
jgi:PAS domain S-box-containing protein